VLPIWGFVAVTLPLVLSPGVSTAVVLRNSVAGGVRAGVETAAGVNAGSVCYGLLSAAGVSLALQRWPSAWVALRLGGTAYIAWLGLQSLRRAFAADPRAGRAERPGVDRGRLAHLSEGFVTNALNPAIATFYLVIVPQFVPRGAPVVRSILILTTIHVALALSWHLAWATAGGTLAHVLSRRRPRQALDVAAGVALILLAAKVGIGS
jgi:threonine/homoserine/homoserine lactone efflux protein